MKQETYRRLSLAAKLLLVAGLGAALLWNLLNLLYELKGWWLAVVLPLPGLFSWLGVLAIPALSARSKASHPHTYRLLYSAPEGWRDNRARQTLLTLIRSGTGLDIIWARDGDEVGCWLAVANYGGVLERLVRDVFPNGALETAAPPEIGQGVVILRWRKDLVDIPSPAEMCGQEGIEGVYFRWRSEKTATVALWGAAAGEVARQFARPEDLLPGQGQGLLTPPFSGDNPWPDLPSFPLPAQYPGLAAISPLERVAPALRINGASALIIGQDAGAQPIGFTLPGLDGVQLLQITGQAAELVVITLVQQAVQARQPVLLLDGRGVVTTRLARRLLREVATERVLMCDVERPGQSRFRLNPLWLPPEAGARFKALSGGWPAWLREQGVTAAGLGLAAYRHTQVAVMLTALVSTERGMALDVPGLREALLAPDFLKLVDEATWAGKGLLDDDIWGWWQTEGRQTSSFDMHLRLAHLRDRLGALLDLPEYSVLWRGPYLDPVATVGAGKSLFWRLPDPRRRLPVYIASQLLALNTLLTAWPQERPLLVFLHELETGTWVERLASFPNIRLVLSTEQPGSKSLPAQPASLLLSRLEGDVPGWLQAELPDVRVTDMRRLPPKRLVLKRGNEICTVDLQE